MKKLSVEVNGQFIPFTYDKLGNVSEIIDDLLFELKMAGIIDFMK